MRCRWRCPAHPQVPLLTQEGPPKAGGRHRGRGGLKAGRWTRTPAHGEEREGRLSQRAPLAGGRALSPRANARTCISALSARRASVGAAASWRGNARAVAKKRAHAGAAAAGNAFPFAQQSSPSCLVHSASGAGSACVGASVGQTRAAQRRSKSEANASAHSSADAASTPPTSWIRRSASEASASAASAADEKLKTVRLLRLRHYTYHWRAVHHAAPRHGEAAARRARR